MLKLNSMSNPFARKFYRLSTIYGISGYFMATFIKSKKLWQTKNKIEENF
jgi:hypothetical protein